MLYVAVDSNNKYSLFNNFPCRIMNDKRNDGYVEVFLPAFDIYILLKENEIESDDE